MKVKNFFLHLKKILVHKFWVAHYCFKLKLYKRGILHDMSKFSPIEFWEGVKYYQGTRSPIDACKEEKGYSLAWQHHKGRNRHHYQYWVDDHDHGGIPIVMPFEDVMEMICDYLGAGRAYYGKEFTYVKELKWWLEKAKQPMLMAPETIKFTDDIMRFLAAAETFPSMNALIKHYARICTGDWGVDEDIEREKN